MSLRVEVRGWVLHLVVPCWPHDGADVSVSLVLRSSMIKGSLHRGALCKLLKAPSSPGVMAVGTGLRAQDFILP